MLEYVLSLYFIGVAYFILKNHYKKPSFELKTIELSMILYITYKHPLLGLACSMVFLRQSEDYKLTFSEKPFRLPVEEQMRPKSSNEINVVKPSGLPIQESLIGQMAKPYKNEPSKIYTSF